MSRRHLDIYHWDGVRWSIVRNSIHSSSMDEPIRLATLNILADCFPWFVETAIRSAERYQWLCDGIAHLNPTILGLNEVTNTALQRLQESSFIRQHYFIMQTFQGNEATGTSKVEDCPSAKLLFPHQCVILSKIPLMEAFAISVSGRKREAIVAKVQLGRTRETCIYLCLHHATPYKNVKNTQLRAQQINDIMDVLKPLNHPFIIMGDLNLYYEFEDNIIIQHQLVDAWAQTHFSDRYPFNDQENGYTFDASKNSLIPYYIPGGCGQMRLDRILFSRGFPAFAIKPCALWANERLKPDDYLFPSDHFGLSIDILMDESNDQERLSITAMSLNEPDPSAQDILRQRAENYDDQGPARLGFIRKTIALTSHALWLGAVGLGLK